jgi:hypothetical protein
MRRLLNLLNPFNLTHRLLIDEDCECLTLFPIETAQIQKPVKNGKVGFGVRPSPTIIEVSGKGFRE